MHSPRLDGGGNFNNGQSAGRAILTCDVRRGLTFSNMSEIEAEPLPATPIEELPKLAERENQIGEVAEWSKALPR